MSLLTLAFVFKVDNVVGNVRQPREIKLTLTWDTLLYIANSGLNNRDGVTCENSGCDGKMTWEDGSSYKHASAGFTRIYSDGTEHLFAVNELGGVFVHGEDRELTGFCE